MGREAVQAVHRALCAGHTEVIDGTCRATSTRSPTRTWWRRWRAGCGKAARPVRWGGARDAWWICLGLVSTRSSEPR